LPVFSPFIGNIGNSKQIANIANALRAIGTFGNGKTNCQYCQNCQWPDRSTARPLDRSTARPRPDPDPTPTDRPRPSTRHQAWIVMPIRSVIVLFARSLFAVGFLLAKPPPRADGLAGQGRWVHKKFFLFLPAQQPNSPTAHETKNFFYF
jgi:hypothetical protein